MAANTPSCETVPKMLNYFLDQIRVVLDVDNCVEIIENSYFPNDKQVVEAHTGHNVEEEEHEEPLVIDVDKLQDNILDYYNNNENSINNRSSDNTSNTTNSTIKSSSLKDHIPTAMVRKIKKSPPPDAEIADAFFELCTVGACIGRHEMMKYMKDTMVNKPFYHRLENYLDTFFYSTLEGRIKFWPLRTIGHLLLCGVPDYYCHAIPAYREKTQAKNVFDADITNSNLSHPQKRINLEYLEKASRENAKVCGFIMCQFMIGCIKNRELPNIDFLTDDITALTDEERNLFISSNYNDLIQFD